MSKKKVFSMLFDFSKFNFKFNSNSKSKFNFKSKFKFNSEFNFKLKLGFSLIEVTVALLILAILVASLTPIITKRMQKSIIAKNRITTNCTPLFPDGYCGMCYTNPKSCIVCTKTCNSDEYQNVSECSCVKCSIAHNDSNCTRCNSKYCTQCKQGYYLDNNKCTICPKGYYCYQDDNLNTSIKKPCQKGYAAPNEGMSSCNPCTKSTSTITGSVAINEASINCTSCNNGYYASTQGQTTNCNICPAGYYCPSGKIIPCAKGSANNQTGRYSTCTLCNKSTSTITGTVAVNEASINCTSCNNGYYASTQGQTTSCATCPAGYYCPSGKLIPCAKGSANNQTGRYSTCTLCNKSTNSITGTVAVNTAMTSCTSCNNGYYASTQGQTTSCATCPAGYYCPSGKLIPCPKGSYCPSGSTNATKCPAGSYSSSTNATSCTKCSKGTYSSSGASSCTSCAAGTYSSSTGATSCTKCTAGYYSNAGATGCTKCAAGYYSNAGATGCTKCADGTYSSAGASSCSSCTSKYANCKKCNNSQCTECASGYEVLNGKCESSDYCRIVNEYILFDCGGIKGGGTKVTYYFTNGQLVDGSDARSTTIKYSYFTPQPQGDIETNLKNTFISKAHNMLPGYTGVECPMKYNYGEDEDDEISLVTGTRHFYVIGLFAASMYYRCGYTKNADGTYSKDSYDNRTSASESYGYKQIQVKKAEF